MWKMAIQFHGGLSDSTFIQGPQRRLDVEHLFGRSIEASTAGLSAFSAMTAIYGRPTDDYHRDNHGI
jgi:hypothetical protein